MIQYGDLRIHPLHEGRFTVGEDKRFVPHDENGPDLAGTLLVSVIPFLVEMPGDLVLLDTGLGAYAAGRDATFLLDGIRRAGFERDQVTRVVFSHLHADHCGGAVTSADGIDLPTFPEATYTCQKGEIDTPEYAGLSAEARRRVIQVLDGAGQLETIEGDAWLSSEIEVESTGGHTRHHQIVRLHTGGRTAVFGGDVLPAPGQIKRRFRAKYDVDPERAQEVRSALVREAADHGQLLLLYHSPAAPCAFVSEGSRGLTVEDCQGLADD